MGYLHSRQKKKKRKEKRREKKHVFWCMAMAGLQQRDEVEERWVPESFSMPRHLGVLIFAYVLSLENFMLKPHYLHLDSLPH